MSTTTTTWRGFSRETVIINGCSTFVVSPHREAAEGRPWILRTMFFDAWPQVDVGLLELGWHLVFCPLFQELGSPRELDQLDAVYDWAVGCHGLGARPVVEGFSRGGLYALNWAIRHPLRPAALYLDAPVCDYRTWPYGGEGGGHSEECWQALLRGHDLTEEAALSGDHTPLARLAPVLRQRLPMAIVAGAKDRTVPWEGNGARLVEMLSAHEVPHQVWLKPECDHHPHSLEDGAPVVEYLVKAFHGQFEQSQEEGCTHA